MKRYQVEYTAENPVYEEAAKMCKILHFIACVFFILYVLF